MLPMPSIIFLPAATVLGLNAETDELLLCGDAGPREAVTPLLRRYISLVMPVIFPPHVQGWPRGDEGSV